MSEQHIIFAPNESGPLHIGNGVDLALIADKAKELNIKVLERLDPISPWNTEYAGMDLAKAAKETALSLDRANELLNVPVADIIYSEARYGRHMGVAHALVGRGVAVDIGHGTIILNNSVCVEDGNYGQVWESPAIIVYRGTPYSSLVEVVDSIDFDIPIWIDDVTLMIDAIGVRKLWPFVTTMPFPDYLHYPEVCDSEGVSLSKSSGVASEYLLHVWARQFKDAEERRGVLRGMVTRPTKDGSRTEFLKAKSVWVDAHGERIWHTLIDEVGQYESAEVLEK